MSEIRAIVQTEHPAYQFNVGKRSRYFGADLLVTKISYSEWPNKQMNDDVYGFFTVTFENGDQITFSDRGEWSVVLATPEHPEET